MGLPEPANASLSGSSSHLLPCAAEMNVALSSKGLPCEELLEKVAMTQAWRSSGMDSWHLLLRQLMTPLMRIIQERIGARTRCNVPARTSALDALEKAATKCFQTLTN